MRPSERRHQYKASLEKRTQESYDNRDSSGKYRGIFEPSKMQGIPKWKPSEDDHSINIIPYIAGKDNPLVPEGDFAYYLDVYIHRAIGINEDSYICVNRTYKKTNDCPICNRIAELKQTDDYDEDYVKSLAPTRRAIYNVEVLDNPKERAKGVQLWDVSHFLFEKELAELAKKKMGGGFTAFSEPNTGNIISFRKKGEGKSTKYHALSFEKRDEPISDELLDNARVLEDLLHIPTYEEVEMAAFGRVADDGAALQEGTTATPTPVEKEPADVPPNLDDMVCPIGMEFGVDFDGYNECDTCDFNKECAEVKLQIEEANQPEPEPVKPTPKATPRPTPKAAAPPVATPRTRVREEAPAPNPRRRVR